MSTPNVSIIVLNYNGMQFLEDCFKSIRENTYYPSYEVLMVDNNSTDKSVNFTRKHFPWVKIIESNENRGFAAGNNIGIKKTCSQYVLLLNTDTIVQPGWLSRIIETAQSDPKIGIVGAIPVRMDLFNKYYRPPNFNRRVDVSEVAGAAMLIKRELLNKVGLLDEYSFLYWEDTEFCWRAYLAGYKVIYDYDAIIYHHVGGSSGNKKWIYEKKKNELYTYLKLLDGPYLWYFTTVAIVKSIGLAVIYPKSIIPISRSFLATFRNLNKIVKQRKDFNRIKEKQSNDLINIISKTRKINDRDQIFWDELKKK